jgi:hypothetical protein
MKKMYPEIAYLLPASVEAFSKDLDVDPDFRGHEVSVSRLRGGNSTS